MRPNRAFVALVALALGGAALLAAAALRFLRAGIPPPDRAAATAIWHGILIPGSGDLAIHLVGYALVALLLGGALRASWRTARQLRRTRRFVARCRAVRGVRSPRLARAAWRADLAGRCDLVVDARPLAFCHGLRRPRVVVSTGLLALLAGRELEAVLRHEAYHAISRDPLRLVAAEFLAAACLFLPLLGQLRDHYAVAAELAADRHAVRGMGAERNLAAALCKLLLLPPRPLPAAAIGATAALALRVDALLGDAVPPHPPLHRGALLGTVAGGAGLALLLVIPLSLFAGDGLALHQPLTAFSC